MSSRRWLPHARAILLYTVVAVAFAWPLPAHLSTHLTGPVDSDTAVYVWNQWVFQHELVENRSLPYFTGKIFSLTPKANLSLHNYTTFANLLALPLIPRFGVIATFNIVFLALTVLTAYAMFLLARELTNGADAEAWLAGLLFAWCPVLVTRGAGHFSLVAAAPLPIFLILLLKAPDAWSWRHGAALGLVMAWAASSDAYYGVFCLMIAAVVLTASVLRMRRAEPTRARAALGRSIDVLIVLLLGLIAAILLSRGWRVTFMGLAVSFRSLYTPVLLLTVLSLARVAIHYRPAVMRVEPMRTRRLVRVWLTTALVCAAVLSPVLYAVSRRIADGRWYGNSSMFWRSSPPGVDLVALVLPNPNHPLAPAGLQAWLARQPNGYLENAASIPLVALLVIVFAWRRGWRAPRVWAALIGVFGLLSLGPFIHVAGLNTYVPGPWALLRYVPVVGLTRSPARFTVILMLALAALFALALRWATTEYPRRRRAIVALVLVLLAVELLPTPRPLYGAAIPPFYTRIAADPRPDVRVLELPFGIRDGTRSVGNFTARSQYFQTFHRKPLIGGYLSRVSGRRVDEIRRVGTLDALITLSEGGMLADRVEEIERRAAAFAERAQVGYVVIDRARAPAELVRFAMRAFRLELLDQHDALELYRPQPSR
jgi:hypothetical protein